MLYLDQVYLKPRYRGESRSTRRVRSPLRQAGYGVGLLAVNQLIRQIPAFNNLIVVMDPCPINICAISILHSCFCAFVVRRYFRLSDELGTSRSTATCAFLILQSFDVPHCKATA